MNKEKILLVDDEEGIRKVLGISLSDIGYTVYTAENGEEAFKIFEEVNPPIVLTDIKMPGMDGIELLKKIKETSPNTEVIMISGHGDMDLAIKSLKYEAVDFVTKPINDDALEIALKRAHEKISMEKRLKEYTENLEALVIEKSARLIELERQAAVGQTIEGLSDAMKSIGGDLENGMQYLNEIPSLVSIYDRDLKIVATNQLYKERIGDQIGKTRREGFGNKAADSLIAPVEETFRAEQGQQCNTTVTYQDGKEAPVLVHTAPIRNSEGALELVMEIAVDTSEIQHLREELRTTQRLYQQLFDEAPCYITVQDRDLRVSAANNMFRRDFDIESGSHCYEVYKHRDEPCLDCPVVMTFEDGKSHESEMVVTSKSGEQYNLLIRTSPVRDVTGKIIQVMEMSTNITQIRKLQDHLSSLGLKIGAISHGIKGLLSGLDSGMYLLDSGTAKGQQDRVTEGMEIVKMIVGRIRRFVLDILHFAKQQDLKWEDVDVISFAQEVASAIEMKAEAQGIELISDFDLSLGEFEVDASVVQSALLNILENAIDACAEDKEKKSHRIVFRVQQDPSYIVFEIEDNGIGIDKETRENLFNLSISSKGMKGTGMGLFITNNIIQQHGGAISVDSTPGKWTRFRIEVPKKPVSKGGQA
jgi:signal transduction histidine kinase/FixJ family two-component response regulator